MWDAMEIIDKTKVDESGARLQWTPLKHLIVNFPDLALLLFDRCFETNLQKQQNAAEAKGRWGQKCVTADSADFRITFNYKLLDETKLVRDLLRLEKQELQEEEEGSPVEKAAAVKKKAESSITVESIADSGSGGKDAIIKSKAKTDERRVPRWMRRKNHPLMIMVDQDKRVSLSSALN